jgi:hypothetical protein
MRLRHSTLSFAAVLGLAACATSGADNEHGPAFTDAGGDAHATTDTGAGHEGGADAASGDGGTDAKSPGDAAAGDGAAGDAPSEGAVAAGDGGSTDSGPGEGGTTCPSTMALLAAGGSSIAQAVFGHGQWSSASVVSGGASAAPALVPLQGGYLGAFVGTGSAGNLPLQWTAYSASWSPPVHVAAALGQGVAALAVIGSSAHVVYWGSDSKFYHGTYAAGSWDAASDRVQPSGGAQSFGPSAPAAAAVGGALVEAQSGQDGVVYDQSWNGSWQVAAALAGTAVVSSLSPAVIAMNGGAADAMVVFVHSGDAGSYYLQFATRTAGTGAWSTPADVYATAGNVAYAGTTPALCALPGGKALLAWQGSAPAYPYVSTYDPAGGWSAPIPVSSDAIVSPPSVAAGVCGADAVMTYVKAGGTVQVVTLSGGSWGNSTAIAGATAMQWAAIATTQ